MNYLKKIIEIIWMLLKGKREKQEKESEVENKRELLQAEIKALHEKFVDYRNKNQMQKANHTLELIRQKKAELEKL